MDTYDEEAYDLNDLKYDKKINASTTPPYGSVGHVGPADGYSDAFLRTWHIALSFSMFNSSARRM